MMPSNEATPFTIREQLEKDVKRAVDSAVKSMLQQYRPYMPFDTTLQITRSAHNRVGNVIVRVRVEIAGDAVEAEWLDERG